MGSMKLTFWQTALVDAVLAVKHLPGQHEQQTHAGKDKAVASGDIEIVRADNDEAVWVRMRLKRPSDEELKAAFAIKGIPLRVFITPTDDDGVVIKGFSAIPGHEKYSPIFKREIYMGVDGPGIHHSEFTLPLDKQQKGLGADFLERSEKLYKKIGIRQIRLTANSQVGRYAWARMGFDFANENGRRTVVDKFYQYLAANGVPYDLLPIVTSTWEIAAYSGNAPGGTPGFLSGKKFLLGHLPDAYEAIKTLDNGDVGYQIGQAYYAARNK